MMRYKVYSDRVKLLDSHLVSKSRFRTELGRIRNLHPSIPLWNRSEGSLVREWAAHVLAYDLGIRRDKTADTDLEYEPKWWMSLFYFVVGGIALAVIK